MIATQSNSVFASLPFSRLAAAALLAGAVVGQSPGFLHLPASLNPATAELPEFHLRPFMQTDSRVQVFFDATEVGASSFTADQLALRFDGPIPQVGAPGPFTIQRLQIRVGATDVARPDARFAANLSAPLVTVFDGPWTYLPDPGGQFPHPWGAPNDSLTFPFQAPASVVIPAGGWLVIELVMQGNGLQGFSHAILDGARATGGPADGTAANSGLGCSAGPGLPAATVGSTGTRAPGAAHFLHGSNLGANALVFALVGLSDQQSPFGPLPFTLPGTSCRFYNSFDVYWLMLANAAGAIPNGSQAGALPLPANPAFTGQVLHEQLLSYVPGANPPWDFVLSDLHSVTLGSWSTPGRGTVTASHGSRWDAEVADAVEAFGYAVRLRLR